MAFDFKKEYKEFYMPKNKPSILTVPPMNYISPSGVMVIRIRKAANTNRQSVCCMALPLRSG